MKFKTKSFYLNTLNLWKKVTKKIKISILTNHVKKPWLSNVYFFVFFNFFNQTSVMFIIKKY